MRQRYGCILPLAVAPSAFGSIALNSIAFTMKMAFAAIGLGQQGQP